MAQITAHTCDRCNEIKLRADELVRTTHVQVGKVFVPINHSDLELCSVCHKIYQEFLTQFLNIN